MGIVENTYAELKQQELKNKKAISSICWYMCERTICKNNAYSFVFDYFTNSTRCCFAKIRNAYWK